MSVVRGLVILVGVVLAWYLIVRLTGTPSFILPTPGAVAGSLWNDFDLLAVNAGVTIAEILLGMACGLAVGCATALAMIASRHVRDWMLPVLVASQAVPVYALAPVLVLWFGFGIWPKVVMATLIIFFPVTAAFFDGLRNTDQGWLDLARSMGASRWKTLRFVRLPAALPALASGVRIAAATAPIGAIVGEWVGASAGLAHVMNQSKAQGEEPRMFAALVVIAALAILLYFAIDWSLRKAIPWHSSSSTS
jgi:putative hydroxymethylpyrimidine transport system permease protein